MFSFALWDSHKKQLFLAVDRFGIKPLYYANNGQGIIFGSELKSIMASGMFNSEIDMDSLSQYLTLGYIPNSSTIYKMARKLQAGFYLTWSAEEGLAVNKYWQMNPSKIENGRTLPETRRQLYEMLKDAVRSHLISDVPLGAFLSGGIDSSTVVALMSEVSSEPIKTFSIIFNDREHDESKYARIVARHFNTDHHEMVLEPDNVDVLPRLVSHFDEPFADASAIPTYYVSKMASQHVKVALSGDGGDEAFVGYTVFQGLEIARHMQQMPQILRKIVTALPKVIPKTKNSSLNDRMNRWERVIHDSMLPPDEAFRNKLNLSKTTGLYPLLSASMNEELKKYNPYRSIDECLANFESNNPSHPLDKFINAIFNVPLFGDILVKVDRMSMANSIEVRVPLLDHVLVEFVSNIPVEQRFPRWCLKGLLKNMMADKLPKSILRHRKHGFNVPVSSWFRGDLNEFTREILLDGAAKRSGYWNTTEMESVLKKHGKGFQNYGSTIWATLVLELWRHQRFD
jgi:asparagine synthase (glutamine-hydrolysing)